MIKFKQAEKELVSGAHSCRYSPPLTHITIPFKSFLSLALANWKRSPSTDTNLIIMTPSSNSVGVLLSFESMAPVNVSEMQNSANVRRGEDQVPILTPIPFAASTPSGIVGTLRQSNPKADISLICNAFSRSRPLNLSP